MQLFENIFTMGYYNLRMTSFLQLSSALDIIAPDDNLKHYPMLLYNISDKGINTNDTD